LIPAASQIWIPTESLPMQTLHPACRLGLGVLAIMTAVLGPPSSLLPLFVAIGWLLARAGVDGRRLASSLIAWWPIVLLVLAVHTFTTTAAAPLGHPSLLGLARGGLALVRVGAMVAALMLLMRLLPLPDLVQAFGWWLRPLRVFGVDTRHVGVTLAVAVGTAPRTRSEADRILACLRLRRSDGRPRRGFRLRERLQVLPPLMEGLARRAETLPLALAGRLPRTAAALPALPWPQGLMLVGWTALLVVLGVIA
jgi:energy-coupling factor transporter transmembrane protein EcfT